MKFPDNPFNPGTGSHRVFEWMKLHRRITTRQLHRVLKVDTMRLRGDVKPVLKQHGLNVVCKEIQHEPRNCVYEVVA